MLNKNITKQNKLVACFCILVYCVITLIRLFHHTPWFDEAHAWTISEQLNFVDMFNYTKNEGHFFLWQTLLYPFAHSNIIPYPYPMQILNWTFCTLAIILMWWKAPFNGLIKSFITFSFPFLGCYSILARCYSIGILLLFALASLYDKKLKYPKTYALLLILCANTSIMALIGTTAFGILFLIDLFKHKLDKKNNILISGILLLGAILILYQLLNIGYLEPVISVKLSHISVRIFRNTFIYGHLISNLIILGLLFIPLFKYFYQDKKSLFFIFFNYFILLIFSIFIYSVNFWHSYFFYIYLIISFWIADNKIDFSKIKIIALSILGVVSFFMIFHYPDLYPNDSSYTSKAKTILNYIESDEVLNKSVIIHHSSKFYEMLPYTKGKNYKIKNYCSIEENTDYNLLNIFYGDCIRENIFEQTKKEPKQIKSLVEKYKNVYAYFEKDSNSKIKDIETVKTKDFMIYFEKYKCFENYCFWKVELK